MHRTVPLLAIFVLAACDSGTGTDGPRPNLRPIRLDVPSRCGPGVELAYTVVIINDGDAVMAGDVTNKAFISEDREYDTSDVPLTIYYSGLDTVRPGEILGDSIEHSARVPDGVLGVRYVVFVADLENEVRESNESDNSIVAGPVEFVHAPDFAFTKLRVDDIPYDPGVATDIIYVHENLGNVPFSGSLTTALYLSADSTAPSDDDWRTSWTGEVAYGGQERWDIFYAGPDLMPGDYYLYLHTDAGFAITEIREDNNWIRSDEPITIPAQ